MKRKLIASLLVVTIVLISGGLFLNPVESQTDRDIYWNGQDIEIEDQVESDTVYSIYNESGDNFIRQIKSNDAGVIEIDSEDYGVGDFNVVEPTEGVTIYKYTTVNQSFGVDESQTVAINEVVEYEILSGRAVFDMNVTSEDMDRDQLVNGLQIQSSRLSKIDNGVTISDAESGEVIELDTKDIDSEDYEIEWNVTDAIGSNTTRLVTGEDYTGTADFDGSLFTVNQGDLEEVYLDLTDTDRVTVQIGRETYQHEVELGDSDDDGVVGFEFDTLEAGNGDKPVEALNGTNIREQDGDTEVDVDVIAPISYTMVAEVGGASEDTAILDVQNPVFDGIETYELSSEVDPTVENEVTGNMTESDSIADKEYAVVELGISSVYSVLPDNLDGSDLSENGVLENELGASLVIEESDPSINSPPEEYDLSDSEATFADTEDNRILVVIDADQLPEIDKDDEDKYSSDVLKSYDVKFELDSDDNLVFDDDIDEEHQFEVENTILKPSNREMNVGLFEDRKHVVDIENSSIEMEGNLAEGREVTVIADTIDTELLIFETNNITNGSISFHVNESQIDLNDEFEIEVPSTGYEYDFVVGSSELIEDIDAPSQIKEDEQRNISVELQDNVPTDELDIEWSIEDATFYGQQINYTYRGDGSKSLDVTVDVSSSDNQYVDSDEFTIETVGVDPIPEPTIESEIDPLLFEGQEMNFNSSVTNVTNDEKEDVTYKWMLNGETVVENSESASIEVESGMNEVSVQARYGDEFGTDSLQFYAYPSTPISEIIFNYYTG